MIHIALWILSALFVAAVCLVVLALWISLMRALVNAAAEVVTITLFCLIVPPVWVWEKARRWVRRRARAHARYNV